MWIKLLQQQKGRISGYEDELDAVIELSESGKAVFPLSRFHAIETASYTGGSQSVDDMFDLMLAVSRRYCIAPFDIVRKEEISREAHRLAGLEFSMDGRIIGQGIIRMHGGDRYEITVDSEDGSELEERLYEFSESEELAKEILEDEGFRELLADRSIEQEIAEDLEEIRKENEDKFKSNSHQREVTTLHYFQESVRPAVKSKFTELLLTRIDDVSPPFDHGISEERLESKEYALEYAKRFPAMYTYTKLTVSRDLQKRKIEKNDLNDILALSIAIPYCDLVLTENFWAAIASQCSLEEDYDTVVSSDLSDVIALK